MTRWAVIAGLAIGCCLCGLEAPAQGAEKVEVKVVKTPLKAKSVLKPENGAVGVEDGKWHPKKSSRTFRALVFPQCPDLTGDTTPAEATYQPGNGNNRGNHIELKRGLVYVQTSDGNAHATEEEEPAPPPDARPAADPEPYPITTVREIDAGAEGTEMLVALMPDPNENKNAYVLVMHMGSPNAGSVWSRANGGQKTSIAHVDHDDMFIAIHVEDYEAANPTYAWIKKLEYGGAYTDEQEQDLARWAKDIYDAVTDYRDKHPNTFWDPGHASLCK